MPNTYTTDENGTYIVDLSGKKYRCNVAHPLPLPEGIGQVFNAECVGELFFFGTPNYPWSDRCSERDTYWLARTPFPEVPRPKTQDQIDAEACVSDRAKRDKTEGVDYRPESVRHLVPESAFVDGFFAALAYARQQQP